MGVTYITSLTVGVRCVRGVWGVFRPRVCGNQQGWWWCLTLLTVLRRVHIGNMYKLMFNFVTSFYLSYKIGVRSVRRIIHLNTKTGSQGATTRNRVLHFLHTSVRSVRDLQIAVNRLDSLTV